MQPYFFPYFGYFQLIASTDVFVAYDDVNYIKGGWINRNNILLNGQKQLVSLALNAKSSFKKINEIEIADERLTKTRQKFLRTIEQAYRKAPNFTIVYEQIIKKNIENGRNKLSEINITILRDICSYLEIKTEIIVASESEKIIQTSNYHSADRVKEICKILQASTYINAIGGQELYDKEDFKNSGLNLCFIEPNHFFYQQYKSDFIPALSIIDVIMFSEKEIVMSHLDDYNLV